MTSTPVTLLERLRRADDPSAWSDFVHLYTPLLYAWACRAGLGDADAADLVQDVFAVLVRELPGFDYQPGRSFRGWLRTVLLNCWRTGQRRRRPQTVPSEDLDHRPAPADPDLPGEAEERRELVRRALALIEGEFAPGTWQAFRRHAMEGRPAAEVAAALGTSVNAVYLARSRVLRRLRQMVGGLIDWDHLPP
jgi:RNA polymerase sigma-70 factor (ECF subfamily)